MRRVRATIVAVESNNYYILCVFVALVIHHAMRMRRVVIYVLSVATVFSTLSHKWQDFHKKSYWTQNGGFGFLYKFCLKHFLL
jgi:hypothetical protein